MEVVDTCRRETNGPDRPRTFVGTTFDHLAVARAISSRFQSRRGLGAEKSEPSRPPGPVRLRRSRRRPSARMLPEPGTASRCPGCMAYHAPRPPSGSAVAAGAIADPQRRPGAPPVADDHGRSALAGHVSTIEARSALAQGASFLIPCSVVHTKREENRAVQARPVGAAIDSTSAASCLARRRVGEVLVGRLRSAVVRERHRRGLMVGVDVDAVVTCSVEATRRAVTRHAAATVSVSPTARARTCCTRRPGRTASRA